MEDFLVELNKLLARYDAAITVKEEDVSEFSGFAGETIWVRVGDEEMKIANDCSIDTHDLKAYLDANVMQSQTLGENLDPD